MKRICQVSLFDVYFFGRDCFGFDMLSVNLKPLLGFHGYIGGCHIMFLFKTYTIGKDEE